MELDGLFRNVVMSIVGHVPMILGMVFGLFLYVSKGDERPRAAMLLLISLGLMAFSMIAMPIGYHYFFKLGIHRTRPC